MKSLMTCKRVCSHTRLGKKRCRVCTTVSMYVYNIYIHICMYHGHGHGHGIFIVCKICMHIYIYIYIYIYIIYLCNTHMSTTTYMTKVRGIHRSQTHIISEFSHTYTHTNLQSVLMHRKINPPRIERIEQPPVRGTNW